MRRAVTPLVLVLLLLAYLATGVTLVRPGERAVVRRFGRVLDTKPAPGLWVGLPWGMDRVDRVPVYLVQSVQIGSQPPAEEDAVTAGESSRGQLVTGDHNLVHVQAVVYYAVNPDEQQIVKYVLQRDRVDGLVARAAEAALAEWVAGRTIDEVLIRGPARLPDWLVRESQRRLQGYDLGVVIQQASVLQPQPPREVAPAFNGVTKAYTAIATQERVARTQAAEREASARAEAYRLDQDARAYADEQRLRARADADAFFKRLEQYRKAPNRAGFLVRLWWDEMGRLFARMKQNGQIDLLDNHLGPDGLDITHMPAVPRRK